MRYTLNETGGGRRGRFVFIRARTPNSYFLRENTLSPTPPDIVHMFALVGMLQTLDYIPRNTGEHDRNILLFSL